MKWIGCKAIILIYLIQIISKWNFMNVFYCQDKFYEFNLRKKKFQDVWDHTWPANYAESVFIEAIHVHLHKYF